MGRQTRLVLLNVSMAAASLYYSGCLRATPPVGFAAKTVAERRFSKSDVRFTSIIPNSNHNDRRAKAWLSQQNTIEPLDLYVQSNVWQPGGSTGWHTHPGNSLIIVTAGTVTEYLGPDRDCEPRVYTKGMSFVDPHGEHVHIIRNEGNHVARTISVQLMPSGARRRMDVADPGNCKF